MSILKSKVKRDMVECTGNLFQRVGLPRSTGQIYGLLYLSKKPLTLDDMVDALGLSKGSASNATRHLVTLGAIKPVWVPGERKDHFEAMGNISSVLKSIYQDFVRPRIGATGKTLALIRSSIGEDRVQGALTDEEAIFCEERLQGLLKLQKKIDRLAPLAEKILL